MDSDRGVILQTRTANHGLVQEDGPRDWRLEIPAGPAGAYRLAQLDDYGGLQRRDFPWRAPLRLSLQARASSGAIPGTWGFGLWNDPFSMGWLGGESLRLPVFPNAAWFFFAGQPNYLALQDDQPGQGWLAMSYQAPPAPGIKLAISLPLAPLLLVPALSRRVRAFAGRFVAGASRRLPVDPVEWHSYSLSWLPGQTTFSVDGQVILDSLASPTGRLGMVVWIDNQFAAWRPDGSLNWGRLENPEPAWIEIRALQYDHLA